MTKLELAKKYFDENPEPIQDLCPELLQYWTTSKGYVMWSNKTGQRLLYGNRRPSGTERAWSVKDLYRGLYVRYIDNLDALEFAEIRIHPDGRGKGVLDWKFKRRILEWRDDTTIYTLQPTIFQSRIYECAGGMFYNKDVITLMNGGYGFIGGKEVCEEICRFDPSASVYFDDVRNSWYMVSKWYRDSFIKRKVKDETLKELAFADLPLPEGFDYEINRCYAEQMGGEYLVVRLFRKGYYEKKNPYEKSRVFIDKNGKVAVFNRDWKTNEFRRSTKIETWNESTPIANVSELEKWNPTKYVIGCVKDEQGIVHIGSLIDVLRHPILEKLSKAGYPNIAACINHSGTVGAYLRDYFGFEKEGKKTQIKDLGVNKYLLERIEKGLDIRKTQYGTRVDNESDIKVVKELKRLYGKDDISSLSKETIDELFDGMRTLVQMGGLSRLVDNNRYYYYRRYNRQDEPEIPEGTASFMAKLCRLSRTNNLDVIRYYMDTKRMFVGLINPPDIDITDFDDFEGLRRIHDTLVEIQREENANRDRAYAEQRRRENEAYQKRFEKLQEKRIADFEKDGDKFCIRVPKTLEEITTEGSELHHCVGGYVRNHATGDTNIIFLRKKGLENMPFYTIEVRNGHVVQIHGKYNRWLGNDPEAVPFVYQWLKERGISFEKRMLLNLGCGYSPSKENLAESYLTA